MAKDTSITRYNDEELSEFQEIIEKKLANATSELEYLEGQLKDLAESSTDNQSGDWFDDSNLHSEIELVSSMANRQRQFIDALNAALIRIKNKTYGVCTVTGKLIDKKRLKVVPHATKSLEAKEYEKIQATGKAEKKPTPPPRKESKSGQKKIISKIIKRSGSKPPPKPRDEDDDFDMGDTEDANYGEDFDDDESIVNMDIEDIADDDTFDDDDDD